nr:glycosyl hydrolase [Candidatus Neomarinimicrobiota bacterium]
WQVYRKAWKMWGGGPFSGIYKTTDGGDTWEELTKNSGMPEGPIGKIGMAVSPADPKRVWAVVEASEGGVFRSDDGGKNWERTNDDRKIRQRHFYYSRIVADPLDRETVYALNTRLYKSTDGGVTFDTQISVPHGDNHDLWIDPNDPKRMVNSNDGGGNVTINGGETWTEQDYSTTQLYHVNVTNDFPYHACGAQQDNSTVCVPSEGWGNMQARGPNHGWYYAAGGGESGYITQHPSNLDIFYAGSQGALLTRYNRATGQIRDIQVYPRFFSGEPASVLPERWQWTFPIVFSPLNEKKLYTCSQHVWLSRDDGQSWKKISPDLTYADPSTLGPTGGLITMDMNGPEIYATVFALTPSKHHINTIWAGSDDGLMHITRNGGKTWDNITPPEMEKFTRISIIEESSHKPGTAYVAANRYQVDDRAPYVWRTRDYGKTWTKIVNGVADGHFARAVREDAVKEGLLFLGTEHGVYVSFDAGDSWQPIQLNLPDTPIRDLQLKNSDVVLGTHGRGFWILDDYDPLREYTDDTAIESLTLFTPHDAVRGEETAIFQYFLSEEADSVQTEIYDSKGNLVVSMVGDSVAQKPTEIHPWYRTRTTGPPTTARGLNRWEWNLRYKGATMFEGIIIWSGRPQNGPKAPPGTYEARITVNEITKSTKFNIKMDPRLKGVSEKDLKKQYQLASQIRDKTSSANEAVIQIRHIREQINDRLKKTKDQQIGKMSTNLIENLTKIEEALYQTKNESGQDPLNFPIRLNNRLASLRRSVENGDAKPTNGAHKVFEELSIELKEHLKAMDQLLTQNLNKLNLRLKSKELETVSVIL